MTVMLNDLVQSLNSAIDMGYNHFIINDLNLSNELTNKTQIDKADNFIKKLKKSKMIEIEIKNCNFTIEFLTKIITHSFDNLTKLDLSGTSLGSQGAVVLANVMNNNQYITEVKLSNCNICDISISKSQVIGEYIVSGLVQLLQSLSTYDSLLYLDLSSNYIGYTYDENDYQALNEILLELVNFLDTSTSIIDLNLTNNYLKLDDITRHNYDAADDGSTMMRPLLDRVGPNRTCRSLCGREWIKRHQNNNTTTTTTTSSSPPSSSTYNTTNSNSSSGGGGAADIHTPTTSKHISYELSGLDATAGAILGYELSQEHEHLYTLNLSSNYKVCYC